MPETHDLPLDVIRKAWDENVKPGAEGDSTGSPWAGVDYEGNEERAVKFARAILTAARQSDEAADLSDIPAPAPGEFDAMVWAKSFVAHARRKPSLATDEGTMVAWFANAIMAGYDGRAESDAAARIAAQREAASRAWDAAIQAERERAPFGNIVPAREAYLDREHPLPPRECVLSDGATVRFNDADNVLVRTGAHRVTVRRIRVCWPELLHDEHTGADWDALKSFAAGVGR